MFFLMQKFPRRNFGALFLNEQYKPTTIEEYQEGVVVAEDNERKARDERAIR